MMPVSTLKNMMRHILLAGLMYGVAGVVHAQLDGQDVGGMSGQGSLAGPYPGERSAFDVSPPGKKGITFIEPGNPGTQQGMSISNHGRRTPAMGSPDATQQFTQPDMSIPDPAGLARTTKSQSPDAARQLVPPYGQAVPGQSPFMSGY
jgi:hypothetical protein